MHFVSVSTQPEWANSLTFDEIDPQGVSGTWAFSPNHPDAVRRSAHYNRHYNVASLEGYAWLVFVR